MKDKNGIEICCENCDVNAKRDCCLWNPKNGKEGSEHCVKEYFYPSYKAYEARIADLEKELNIVQESERAEAQEADRLRAEVKELGKKLTETVKLLGESSRECGKLEAEVKVLKAFILKVHTSPIIFEDVNRALRDEAKTLWEKLNQSTESEEK